MYGLPKSFDPSSFIGCVLEMVCFNANQIYLHFDRQTTLMIEGALVYKNAIEQVQITPPVTETNLMQLIGHAIMDAAASLDGKLVLTFDNGDHIQCLDNSSNYESYQIIIGDKTVVV